MDALEKEYKELCKTFGIKPFTSDDGLANAVQQHWSMSDDLTNKLKELSDKIATAYKKANDNLTVAC